MNVTDWIEIPVFFLLMFLLIFAIFFIRQQAKKVIHKMDPDEFVDPDDEEDDYESHAFV